MNRRIRTARIAAVCVLTLCLAVGMIPLMGEDYESFGASEFGHNTPFSGTGRTTYTHNGKFSGHLIANGVDVSAYQSTKSDWNTAKKNGVDYAIMRVTWTGYRKDTHAYKNKDSSFATNYKNAKAAGIMVGAYVFSQAKTETEAVNEANYAIARLKELGITPDKLDLPVYMDYEFAGGSSGRLYGLKKATATKCAAAFCRTIRAAGYTPGIYASKSFYDNYITLSSLGSDVDVWCAQYWYKCAYTQNYSKWQYSSEAKISGILSSSNNKVGNVDVNFWYIDKNSYTFRMSEIYGTTEYNYTGNAVKPVFEIYDGDKLLKEGTDYVISGISNVKQSTNGAYAYIRGIGSYSGYAVVPFTIGTGYIRHLGLGALTKADGEIALRNASELAPAKDALQSKAPEETPSEDAAPAEETAPSEETAPAETQPQEETAPQTDADQTQQPEQPAEVQPNEATQNDASASVTSTDTTAAEDTVSSGEQAQTGTPAAGESEAAPATVEGEGEAKESEAAQQPAEEVTVPAYGFKIGTNSYGSYIRNVPDGLTVSDMLKGLTLEEDFAGEYTLGVIDGRGNKVSDTTTVRTGMMLAAYKNGTLAATADIAVNGDSIIDASSNFVSMAAPATTVVKKVSVTTTYIRSLKRYKKAFKVKVKKRSGVTGYQVRYSTKKNMSGAVTKTISSKNSKVTKKITKLKGGKRYYVQVRSYKKVGGKTYYSGWSKKKSVKTKK